MMKRFRENETKRYEIKERYIYISINTYIYYIFNKVWGRKASVSSKKSSVNNDFVILRGYNGETIKIVNMLIVRY